MRRSILADLSNGTIVHTRDGRWGVLCTARFGTNRNGWRVVDFWDGGREYVRDTAVVELA